MRKLYKTVINFSLTVAYLFIQMTSAFATDGEDILAEPTQSLFATFRGTGIKLLLLMEIIAACYYFTSGERKMKVWCGIIVLIFVTSYAAIRFA